MRPEKAKLPAPRVLHALRVALLVLVALLAACGGPAGAPRAPSDNLVVGGAKEGASQPVAAPAVANASEDDALVPVSKEDAVRGKRLAYVTVVVFTDFQCPFCGKLATTLERVEETYGEDVRIVLKNEPLPFHPHAQLAAEIGQGVLAMKGQEAFWRYHDMAFRRQPLLAPDTLRAWAISAGADARDLEEGLTRKTWTPKVERDHELAQKLGVRGTPHAFINGVAMSGAQPFERFKELVDTELAKAKQAAQQGAARDAVYARMVAANYDAPLPKPGRDDGDDDDNVPTEDAGIWKVPVGNAPVRGSASALVTVVEFSDFQCPYCKRAQPTLERLRKDYGDRVRFVWKDEPLPFHARAVPAAHLARAARAQKGEAGFWTVHDKLFDSQPKLDDADLEAVARAAGLDVPRAMAAVKTKAFAAGIEADLAFADDVQASGTPHFFINGRRLIGAQPYDKFKGIIDQEIVKAEALVKSGVARTAVYDTTIKSGKSAPEPERKTVALPASAPFRGAANAKVVIQEFSDFQCPFCSRVEPTIDELLKAYPGKVKVVWRHHPLPMHADASLAAEAAHEAFVQKGNEGFSRMRELLFAHQRDAEGLKRAALETYAATAGLDVSRFRAALDGRTHRAVVEADDKAAREAGISGTPAFLVGPYFLAGAQPLAKFKRLVERALVAK